MSKFYSTISEEQESIINIDYAQKEVSCYTSRYAVYERLLKRIGQPTQIFYTDKKVSGAIWKVPFSDKKILNIIFSKTVVIGQC